MRLNMPLPHRVMALALVACGLALLLVAGCGTEPPPRWPWWTADDTAAVRAEIGPWRNFLSANHVMTGGLQGTWSSRLLARDSTSATGDTIYKLARLLGFTFAPTDSGHYDGYLFGVTADTAALKDTFCELTYRDSMVDCRFAVEYDSLWVVGFRPDTTIDTTATPPETTITYRVSSTELRGFETPQTESKGFAWSAMRKLFLSRDTLPDTLFYTLDKTTGFASYTPTSQDAPSISRIILTRTGRVDTVFYSPRSDGRGLYNLKPFGELYTVEPGEPVSVTVTATTPPDTTVDKNRFFLLVDGVRTDITSSARSGGGTITFSKSGYQHLYIEVVPLSNLLYPDADYVGTVWAFPVRVAER